MSKSLIFITGATGFIGAHVVSQSLDAGYRVRLSVRKEEQIPSLRKIFSRHAADLDFTIVPDFSSPGRFSKALEGVTYVFHLASPMPGKGSDFKTDYLAPAVQGTIALLDAARETKSIKRVVIVSSALALLPPGALATGEFAAKEGLNPTIDVDPDMSFPEDPAAGGGAKYHVSKILAHRATLEWARANRPPFSLVTLHPSFVFGRSLTQASAEALSGTNAMLWACLRSPRPTMPMSAVDVRDVALAHLRALGDVGPTRGEAEEFLLSAGTADGWTWEGLVAFVRSKYPALGVRLEGPFDEPPVVETHKAEAVLGLRWRPMDDTVASFLDQQVELGAQL